jgi:hypothetical protein
MHLFAKPSPYADAGAYLIGSVSAGPQKLHEVNDPVLGNRFRLRWLFILPGCLADSQQELAIAFTQIPELTAPIDLRHTAALSCRQMLVVWTRFGDPPQRHDYRA